MTPSKNLKNSYPVTWLFTMEKNSISFNVLSTGLNDFRVLSKGNSLVKVFFKIFQLLVENDIYAVFLKCAIFMLKTFILYVN